MLTNKKLAVLYLTVMLSVSCTSTDKKITENPKLEDKLTLSQEALLDMPAFEEKVCVPKKETKE